MMKKLLLGILVLILAYLLYHYQSVQYGIQQAYGQWQVLSSSEELDEYLQDPEVPDSMIKKIELIRSVKAFAEDSLGLDPTDTYNSIYDQKGEPILWMVTASPEFELKAYEWEFPIAGKFSYKGFFEKEYALEEQRKMKNMGYDTQLNEVSAWSTLGWLDDPILSSMLERDSGRLADLIIHELSHASIYLKDSVELNENLASFIGKKGAEMYLRSIGDSISLRKMNRISQNRNEIRKLTQLGSKKLDSLYRSFDEDISLEEKRRKKSKMMERIRWQIADKRSEGKLGKAEETYLNFNPNNAYFTGFLTYRSRSTDFENEFEDRFNGNLKAFIEYYKHR